MNQEMVMNQVVSNFVFLLAIGGCILSISVSHPNYWFKSYEKEEQQQQQEFSPEHSKIEVLFQGRTWIRPSTQTQYAEASSALYLGNDILTQESSPIPQSSAIKDEGYRWPGFPGEAKVPYVIDSTLNSIKDLISQAIEQYHNLTCIRFVERKEEKDYVTLLGGQGCTSFVGRQGGNQKVTLGAGCHYVGTIVHELGHAIGLYHEHQRTDRDDYIRVFLENVKSGQESNFEKTSPAAEKNLTRFNYNSIMIYGEYAFSKNKTTLKTMQARNKSVRLTSPYDKPGLDNTDILQVNKLYECKGYEN